MPLVGMPPFLLMGFVGATNGRPFFVVMDICEWNSGRAGDRWSPLQTGERCPKQTNVRYGRPFGNIVPENTGKKVNGKCV